MLWKRSREQRERVGRCEIGKGVLILDKTPQTYCPRCKQVFVGEVFPDGKVHCLNCYTGVQKRWRRHHVNDEQFFAMVRYQGSRCLLCNKRKYLVIDHDHYCKLRPRSVEEPYGCKKLSCGKCVRGLLCDDCNQDLPDRFNERGWRYDMRVWFQRKHRPFLDQFYYVYKMPEYPYPNR